MVAGHSAWDWGLVSYGDWRVRYKDDCVTHWLFRPIWPDGTLRIAIT